MSSRTLLCATAVAALALTLTACDPSGGSTDGSSAAGSPAASAAATSSAAQTAPPAGTASGTGKPGAGKSATPCDPAPTQPPGTRIVNLTKPAIPTTLFVQDGVPSCNEVDIYWEWNGAGPEKILYISPTAKIELNGGAGVKPVTLQQFITHTQKCETGGQDSFSQCVRKGTAYKVTQDSAGKVTSISEIFQS